MKVIDWISEEDVEKYELEISVGTLGGFFGEGMRWRHYIKIWKKKKKEYIEAIRESILCENLKFGGDEHQWGEGVPLFDDWTVGSFSYRAWGDLMAAIWSEEENVDYKYMDFYLNCCMSDQEQS